MPQVSVDIFRGFPDEESIVNYTLNQAYQDNVSVFASEWSLDLIKVFTPKSRINKKLCMYELYISRGNICDTVFQ